MKEINARLAAGKIEPAIAETFPLTAANRALESLRSGKIHGAGVLVPGAP
jgi:D-arabinose 1-dehydrogenase-like Zn-dependent alcohol dehydrogenase